MKYNYMLSDSYCRNWTVQDAIREIIANALSTRDEVKLDWHNGTGKVQNLNRKLEVRHLLIGESDSREDMEAIGTFGEGLKIAGLVLCREGRKYIARTPEHTFAFGIEYANDFKRNMLTVDVNPCNNGITGTLVEFECSDDEFHFAKGLFRILNPVDIYEETASGTILREAGKVYVLGVYIGEQDLLFGYDLKNKTLINRDRSIVDMAHIRSAVTRVLEKATNHEVIKDLIEASIRRDKVVETQILLCPDWGKPKDAWRQVIENMDKVVIASGNHEIDAQVQHEGYRVIDAGHLNPALTSYGGIKDAEGMVEEIKARKPKRRIPIDSLEIQERRNLNRAIGLYRNITKLPPCKIMVSDELDEDILAICDNDDNITISRGILRNFPKAFMLLCREGAHIKSGYGICSASFEEALCEVIENIAKAKLSPKAAHRTEISV